MEETMAYNNVYKGSTNRVAIYVRVSTLHQIDKDSLPMQKQDLIAYSKLMINADDFVIFEDAGYSGKNTIRPKYQEMMTQIRNGAFSHLLVWKIDRISRNLLDFVGMYNELKELGVIFVSKSEQFDTSTAMGEAMMKIILVFAELERNMTSERVTATMISRAGNGLFNGGRIPYGYAYDGETMEFTLIEHEAEVVRMIHDLYEEYCSLVLVCRYLNDKGYLTRAGNMWSPTTIHKILLSVFYCGTYRYNVSKDGNRTKQKPESEWVLVENHHVDIITKEQKNRIFEILKTNRRLCIEQGMYRGTKHTHIFAGLLFCHNCNRLMHPAIQPKKDWTYSKYNCTTRRSSIKKCKGKWTSDPVVGEFVFNYILNMLNAQKKFFDISSPLMLQDALLKGKTFEHIDYIEQDGLNDLYNVLLSGNIKCDIYGKGLNIKQKKNSAISEIANLRKEKQKLERALDRLTNLYLYADASMSDTEFVIQKSKITEALEEINDKIGLENSKDGELAISDDIFIQRASEFIISQKLTDRNYVYYKKLAMSVDKQVLKTFVNSIIDNISMDAGRVKRITFKNGLSHTFVFKE